jgi:hypothetical protein
MAVVVVDPPSVVHLAGDIWKKGATPAVNMQDQDRR